MSDDELRERLFEAYVSGFMQSNEGGNAHNKEDIRFNLRDDFNGWLEGREKVAIPKEEVRQMVERGLTVADMLRRRGDSERAKEREMCAMELEALIEDED